MEKEDRRRLLTRRVDEMHAQALHLGAEVAMPVPTPGAGVEVEALAPSFGQAAHPLEADSSSGPERLWPPRRAQARAQVPDLLLRERRRKRFWLHGRRTIARDSGTPYATLRANRLGMGNCVGCPQGWLMVQ